MNHTQSLSHTKWECKYYLILDTEVSEEGLVRACKALCNGCNA